MCLSAQMGLPASYGSPFGILVQVSCVMQVAVQEIRETLWFCITEFRLVVVNGRIFVGVMTVGKMALRWDSRITWRIIDLRRMLY